MLPMLKFYLEIKGGFKMPIFGLTNDNLSLINIFNGVCILDVTLGDIISFLFVLSQASGFLRNQTQLVSSE